MKRATSPNFCAFVAACGIALGATAAHGEDRLAQQVRPSPTSPATGAVLSAAELEEAFWVCDYVATTRGLDATPTELCGMLYVELKETKFGGDFGLLLAWWQQNKAAEHRKLASRGL